MVMCWGMLELEGVGGRVVLALCAWCGADMGYAGGCVQGGLVCSIGI